MSELTYVVTSAVWNAGDSHARSTGHTVQFTLYGGWVCRGCEAVG